MTALGIAYSRADADPALPDLADVLDLAVVAGTPVEHVTGLVHMGEAYSVRVIQEWSSCGCQDGKHDFRKDNPYYSRGGWHQTRADAERITSERAAKWPEGRVAPHTVTHLLATTYPEVVKAR